MLTSAGKPAGIHITPDKKEISADGQSLIHAAIEVVDEKGRLVPTAELKAEATVEGKATLVAFGTGNPKTTENYTKGVFTSYKGKLLAIVRAGYESGMAELKVSMEGLESASVHFNLS